MRIALSLATMAPLFWLFATPSRVAASEESPTTLPPILHVSMYHGDEFPEHVESGQTWLALVHDTGTYTLTPTTITVSTVNDPILDAEDEATGKEVAVDLPGEVIGLFQARDGLAPGPVTAAEQPVAFGTFLYPGQSVYLDAGEGSRPLVLFAYARVEPHVEDNYHMLRMLNYTLAAKSYHGDNQLTVQQFASVDEVTEDGAPRLVFAGDFNRDGHLDLLMDLATHYNMSHPALYLSRTGSDGAPTWENVAELVTTGC